MKLGQAGRSGRIHHGCSISTTSYKALFKSAAQSLAEGGVPNCWMDTFPLFNRIRLLLYVSYNQSLFCTNVAYLFYARCIKWVLFSALSEKCSKAKKLKKRSNLFDNIDYKDWEGLFDEKMQDSWTFWPKLFAKIIDNWAKLRSMNKDEYQTELWGIWFSRAPQ